MIRLHARSTSQRPRDWCRATSSNHFNGRFHYVSNLLTGVSIHPWICQIDGNYLPHRPANRVGERRPAPGGQHFATSYSRYRKRGR